MILFQESLQPIVLVNNNELIDLGYFKTRCQAGVKLATRLQHNCNTNETSATQTIQV